MAFTGTMCELMTSTYELIATTDTKCELMAYTDTKCEHMMAGPALRSDERPHRGTTFFLLAIVLRIAYTLLSTENAWPVR
eukprot:942168-Rhodomonas_salina.1